MAALGLDEGAGRGSRALCGLYHPAHVEQLVVPRVVLVEAHLDVGEERRDAQRIAENIGRTGFLDARLRARTTHVVLAAVVTEQACVDASAALGERGGHERIDLCALGGVVRLL